MTSIESREEFQREKDKSKFIGREAKIDFPVTSRYDGLRIRIVGNYDRDDIQDTEEVFWVKKLDGTSFFDGTFTKAFHYNYLELENTREWDEF